MYSNSDYGLLRLILEKAAGEDLREYMKRRMFAPLRMNSTRLAGEISEVIPRHAQFYAPNGDGYRHSDVKNSPGGNYTICTSALDLGLWAKAHSDSKSEVSRAVAKLLEGENPVPGLDGHYSFGQTFVHIADRRVVRHEGVLACNYLTRVPDLDLSVITFTNRYYEPEENRAIVKFLLDPAAKNVDVRFPTEPVSLTVEELESYAGSFVSTNIPSWESRTLARDLIQVDVVDGKLKLTLSWGSFTFVSVGERTFSWRSGEGNGNWGMLLEFGGTGGTGPLELVLKYDDGSPVEKYVRLDKWTPSAASLRRVVGTYHSAHLDYSWTLMIDNAGELVLQAPTMADIRVEPYQEGEFLLRHEKFPGVPTHVWVRFHENKAGEVTHLTVWNPRLMHHRFDRR